MQPGRYDLRIYQGDTFRLSVTCWQDAAKTTPADLTGADVAAQIRDQPSGALQVALTCTVEAPNILHCDLAASATASLPPRRNAWDLEVTWPGGDVQTILAGFATVTADVTEPVP